MRPLAGGGPGKNQPSPWHCIKSFLCRWRKKMFADCIHSWDLNEAQKTNAYFIGRENSYFEVSSIITMIHDCVFWYRKAFRVSQSQKMLN